MAEAGKATMVLPLPTPASACTNMPGRSLPPGLASVACTWMFRVASSTIESIAVTRPEKSAPGRLSDVMRTVRPTRIWLEDCCASVALRSEEHTSELQSHSDLVCRLLLEKKKEKRQKSLKLNE